MLKNKTILLISPQPWGNLHVSKHHYALELVERGNEVLFLSPPDYNLKESFSRRRIQENLTEITFKPLFSTTLRFKFRFLFDFLMKIQVNRLLKAIGKEIDIVWCFEPNLYTNLEWFGAKTKIYHPVDPITFPYQVKPAESADVVLSVSAKILSAFRNLKTPGFFINHGLSSPFEVLAQKKLDLLKSNKEFGNDKLIKVGYVGNLIRPELDRELLLRLIRLHQNIEFHIWGPYKQEGNNLTGVVDKKTIDFIDSLSSCENAKLHGPKSVQELAEAIGEIDIFLMLYNLHSATSDRSNSHKILEYLSTGSVVVSYSIDTYSNENTLIAMPKEDTPESLIQELGEVFKNFNIWNSTEFQLIRLNFALNNTYRQQIDKIELILSQVS